MSPTGEKGISEKTRKARWPHTARLRGRPDLELELQLWLREQRIIIRRRARDQAQLELGRTLLEAMRQGMPFYKAHRAIGLEWDEGRYCIERAEEEARDGDR